MSIKDIFKNDPDKFGKDKIIHFLVCLIISFFSTEAALGAALAKEYGDKTNPNSHWCYWDLVWDCAGILVGSIIRMICIGKYNWY